MEDKMEMVHNTLMAIYDKAESVLNELKKLGYHVELNSYNKHFIKINGHFVEQKYFMPVITVEDKGDICFNLDGEQFEFYVTKMSLLSEIDLSELISIFGSDLSIYEFQDCTIDVYNVGDSEEDILKKVNESRDTRFGVSLNSSNLSVIDLITRFDKLSSILKL